MMKVYKIEPLREQRTFTDLRELVSESASRFGGQPAYIFRRRPGGEVMSRSFEDLWDDVQSMGEFILQYFSADERAHFAFVGPNSYEWMLLHLAALTSGTVSVPLDHALPEGELMNLLKKGGCRLFCAGAGHFEAAFKALEEIEPLEMLIINDLSLGKKDKVPALPEPPEGKVLILLSEALRRGEALRQRGEARYLDVPQDTEAMAAIFFTSGTTAAAKGVMLSQKNILSNIHSIARTMPVYPGERFLSVLPMHHTFEHTAGQFFPLSEGAAICFADGLRHIGNNLKEWEISCMVGVPLLFESIWRVTEKAIEASGKRNMVKLARPIARGLESAGIKIRRKVFAPILDKMGGRIRLMVVGAAAADLAVIKGFNDIGIEFLQGYGLTEHTPVVSVNNSRVNVEGSVGQPIADVEVAIAEDPELEAGQGEILVRSDSVMLGYYENEEETRRVIDDEGWLHTGDMGYFDHKNSLHITGRYKSVIVLANGKKAFPEEIESLFGQIPGVSSVMVWGERNVRDTVDLALRFELKAEELPAELKAQDKKIADYLEKEIRRVNKLLPDYKTIKFFVFSDEPMVRNTTLKIKRNQEIDRLHLAMLTEGKLLRDVSGRRIF